MDEKKSAEQLLKQLTPEQVKEANMANLQQMHLAAFAKYVEARFPNGQDQDVPMNQMDMLLEAFQCGFNSGIVQAAGELLAIVGVDLNDLSKAKQAQTTEEK